jgi:hypothetical protein
MLIVVKAKIKFDEEEDWVTMAGIYEIAQENLMVSTHSTLIGQYPRYDSSRDKIPSATYLIRIGKWVRVHMVDLSFFECNLRFDLSYLDARLVLFFFFVFWKEKYSICFIQIMKGLFLH